MFFVESQKSKTLGSNPGQGQLKVEFVALHSMTGACRGGGSWMLTALCKRGASQCYMIPWRDARLCQFYTSIPFQQVKNKKQDNSIPKNFMRMKRSTSSEQH
eukprot:15020019-Ditylum_brightwellii.AAC.1